MQPVLSLVPAAILVLAALAPGGAGAETTREGIRAGPELAQGLTDKGRTAQPPPQGGGDGGWLGLTGRLLDFFSDGHPPPTTERGCAVGSCPSGMQCCCCGDQCYCKRECSLQRCR
jgi:hypothetical protein